MEGTTPRQDGTAGTRKRNVTLSSMKKNGLKNGAAGACSALERETGRVTTAESQDRSRGRGRIAAMETATSDRHKCSCSCKQLVSFKNYYQRIVKERLQVRFCPRLAAN